VARTSTSRSVMFVPILSSPIIAIFTPSPS
jgi:hypothetical protein